MRTSARLGPITLAASLLLAIAVSAASARNLSVSSQSIRVTWTSLEFNAEEFLILRCKATIEGSFHTRTIAKVARSLIGLVTKAVIKQETCTNGTVAFFNGTERHNGTTQANTLPWHLTYEGFTGLLPNITVARLLFTSFRGGVRDGSGLCTAKYGTVEDNMMLLANREAGSAITTIEPMTGANRMRLALREAGIFCPASVTLLGSGTVMTLGSTSRLRVTLI